MFDKHEVELWVAMNEDGGYSVSTDESEVLNDLIQAQGGNAARVVKVTLQMTAPRVDEVAGEVPDDAGTVGELKTA